MGTLKEDVGWWHADDGSKSHGAWIWQWSPDPRRHCVSLWRPEVDVQDHDSHANAGGNKIVKKSLQKKS